jgi:glyoxylase-like metal-dependent hydrolase (beta-lactamase superfamily II)
MTRNRAAKFFLTTLAFTSTLASTLIACGPSEITVQSYMSDPGFAVGSYLITGQTEAVLVDGQFFKADGQKVAQLVKDSGKTLKSIFLTHAHPDHYAGLEEILKVFPGVPVQSTAEVVADFNAKAPATLQGLKAGFPGLIADNLVNVTALSEGKLELEGNELQVVKLREGESVTAAALYAPRSKLLFAGDALYNDAYLWLAECKTTEWSQNIETLRGLGALDKIYPGHGAAPATSAVLDVNLAYLREVPPLLKAAPSATEAIAQVKQKYPSYTGPGLLELSTPTFFDSCR